MGWSFKKAVDFTEAEEARFTATVKNVRKCVLETEIESDIHLWIKVKTNYFMV